MSEKAMWPTEPIQRLLAGRGMQAVALEAGMSKRAAHVLAVGFDTAVRKGRGLTLRTMDTICVQVFNVHPAQLYGPKYWDVPPEELDGRGRATRAKLGCRRCGGLKRGGRHYCPPCRDILFACACGCGESKQEARDKYAPGHYRRKVS